MNDDVTPQGLTTEQLNEMLKRAYWTPEMLAQALYATPRVVRRQITEGKINAIRPLDTGDALIPVAEVKRLLGLD